MAGAYPLQLVHQHKVGLQAYQECWKEQVIIGVLQVVSLQPGQGRSCPPAAAAESASFPGDAHRSAQESSLLKVISGVTVMTEFFQLRVNEGTVVAF